MMKHYLVIGVLGLMLIMVSSCMMGTENPFDNCDGDRPLNNKEKKLYRELKDKFNGSASILRVGYQYRPKYYGLNCEWFGKEYEIAMFAWSDDQINDTLFRRQFIKDLSLDIYNNILEDSIKNYINEFKFTLGNFDSPDSLRFKVDFSIKKNDIEKFLGKKLIVKNKQFQIAEIKKVKDLKFIEVVRD